MLDEIPRWLRISESVAKILILLLGLVTGIIALPWTKDKIEKAEKKADSSLVILNTIQTQIQAQIQQQKQAQVQNQKQQQEQTQSNVQQTEVKPNIIIPPDTSRFIINEDRPVIIDSQVACNSWIPIPTSHDAEFRIECFLNIYDSVKVKVRFKTYEYDSILRKNEEKRFTDSFSFYQRWIFVEFKDFLWSGYPHIRAKYVDYKILEKKRPGVR